MKVIMRLYRQHDLDLIYLYKKHGFSFQEVLKESIRSYICGNLQYISLQEPVSQPQAITLPRQIQFHLTLSESDDADIILWLSKITRGYRNSMLKNLFRACLPYPILTPYLNKSVITLQQEYTKHGKLQDESSLKTPETLSQQAKKQVTINSSDIAETVLHTPLPTGDALPHMNESNDVLSPTSEPTSSEFLDAFMKIVDE